MFYKYYTCDLLPPNSESVDGSITQRFSIFKNPVECHREIVGALESQGFKDYRIVNFRRVK